MRPVRMGTPPIAHTTIGLAVLAALSTLPRAAGAQRVTNEGPPEEIVVTSSIVAQPRRQIGTAVSVIDSGEMELRGYSAVADALRTQPGIGVSNSGGLGKDTALRIRGEESYRTLLMIDGVKALDPSAPRVSPSFDSLLTTHDLERVEVLRGPQGFIYGADAGGVVNVFTKTGAGSAGGQASLESGEFGTRRLDAGLSGGGEIGDYFVSVADLETDGFNARTDDTALHDDDGADNTTLHTKLGWSASANLRLQLVARDIDAEASHDRCYTPSFDEIHDCAATTEQTTYRLSADYDRGDFSNVFGYGSVKIARDNLAAGVSSFATEGSLDRLEYTGVYRPSALLTLVYGLDFQDEELVGSGSVLRRDQKGYYVEYQGAFADTFFLTLGTRYDDSDDFGSHTSTRLSGAYVHDLGNNRSLKYRASVGTGFRAPSLYEMAYNAGPNAFPPAAGLDLVEESSSGYDLGVEYAAANGLRFEVTYFDQEIDDEIYFDPDGFSGYLQSSGTSTSKGVEIATEIPLGERFELLANWTNNDAEDSTHQQRLRRPQNLGNVGLLYRTTGDKFSFVANYRLSQGAVDISNEPLDDYEVLDLSMAYTLTAKFELFGRVQNATDEEYEEVAGYNTADRAAYAGVRLKF